MMRRRMGSSRTAPARRSRATLGQTTIEYVLIICACSVPLSYAIWYLFFHPADNPPLVVFLSRVIDFVSW